MAVSTALPARNFTLPLWPTIWATALLATAILYLAPGVAPWAVKYPTDAIPPIADGISAAMLWLKINFSWLTRGISDVLNVPLQWAMNLLAKGWRIGAPPDGFVFPRLSWVGVCAAFTIAGYAIAGWRLSALAAGCVLYMAVFGQWTSAMLTLALISISVPLCIAGGLAFGVIAYRHPRFDRVVIEPLLDLMQTMPTFAYLIPMLLLFGTSPVSAMLATTIFALPPMVRATALALRRVPHEIDEFGAMVGCTRRQQLINVLRPTGRPMLMVGVNQVIMLALNMVIISSMIGGGGLGYDVLLALRALKIGQGMEAGLAIVAIAILLDRLSQAAAHRRSSHVDDAPLWRRHGALILAVAILLVTTLLSIVWPGLAAVPAALKVSTAVWWKAGVDWLTVNYFDVIEAVRTTLLLYVLNPIRFFLEGFPWLGAVGLLGLAGFSLGGWRLSLLAAALTAF